MAPQMRTKILMLSDTHGEDLKRAVTTRADVAIHCGDLTEESKLHEFRSAIRQLKAIDADIKLVIAGNHDFTLDDSVFTKTRNEIQATIDEDSITSTYGKLGEARALFEDEFAKADGILFLDEGTHIIALPNGALLTVYASPYSPSKSSGWGFQYDPQIAEHQWAIPSSVDIVMTHGPAHGVLDYTEARNRAGSQSLFAAVARARPKVHCFGHIHEPWGAKMVTWRAEVSERPSHFSDIDNDEPMVIESWATLRDGKYDTAEMREEKAAKRRKYDEQGYRDIDSEIRAGEQTLFVNAAIEGVEEGEQQVPWLVDIDLPSQ